MRVFMLGLCATVALGATAHAQEKQTSNVRLAAIERLQSKLGDIRGTLKRDDRNVFVTEFMIEQLKPIKINRPQHLKELQASGDYGLQEVLAVDDRLLREANRVAGLSGLSEIAGDVDFTTTASTLAGPTSMQDLMKLADKLAKDL